MDVEVRKSIDVQKKKKRIQLGNIQNKEQNKRLYRKENRKRKTQQNKSGGLRRLQLPNSFLLFLSREISFTWHDKYQRQPS